MNKYNRLPQYLRVKLGGNSSGEKVRSLLADLKLNTVCNSAKCPNRVKCFRENTATFMILGAGCSRKCRFCAVGGGTTPEPVDENEPERIAEAAERLNLDYVVITSVTRDDLPDGGSEQFAATVKAVLHRRPDAGVEILTPDFNGDLQCISRVINCGTTVFNHNLETVARLTPQIRSRAGYLKSLNVLEFAAAHGNIPVKSGIMLGLGERQCEVETAIRDLFNAGVTILTIGQYLPPSPQHWPLDHYISPEEFDMWRDFALKTGFKAVAAAPLVRSSYQAKKMAVEAGWNAPPALNSSAGAHDENAPASRNAEKDCSS